MCTLHQWQYIYGKDPNFGSSVVSDMFIVGVGDVSAVSLS